MSSLNFGKQKVVIVQTLHIEYDFSVNVFFFETLPRLLLIIQRQ